jgi:hypothetical protein
VLLPRRALDCGDDLSRDAELGEGAERGLTLGLEVADGLVKADHAFLDNILFVGTDQEIGARLYAREVLVSDEEVFERNFVTRASEFDNLFVCRVLKPIFDFERAEL